MNETLEVETCREIEAELRDLTLKARRLGALSGSLLGAAAVIAWATNLAALPQLSWTLFCAGVLCGFGWIGVVVEANRAKVELSLHLAKGQLLMR